MANHVTKVLALFFLAAYLIHLPGPARAQEKQLTCADIDSLVEQFLPRGMSFIEATHKHIDSAIYQAVLARPDIAVRIISCSCARIPGQARVIVFAPVAVLPDKKDALVAAAKEQVPAELAGGIEKAAQAAFALASQIEWSEKAAIREFARVYREWTPLASQEDAPASPYKP
jgi:hypothetical protein